MRKIIKIEKTNLHYENIRRVKFVYSQNNKSKDNLAYDNIFFSIKSKENNENTKAKFSYNPFNLNENKILTLKKAIINQDQSISSSIFTHGINFVLFSLKT